MTEELLDPRKYVESLTLWDAGPVERKSVSDIIGHYLQKAGIHERLARVAEVEKERDEYRQDSANFKANEMDAERRLVEVELREEELRNALIFAKPWLEYTMKRQGTGLYPPDTHPLEKLLREVGEALSTKKGTVSPGGLKVWVESKPEDGTQSQQEYSTKCTFCGKEKPDVKKMRDPWVYELEGKEEYGPTCEDCYQQRSDDI